MNISSFSFQTLNWSSILKEEHKGETGLAYWQVFRMGEIRVRKVEYSAGYKADHWCKKGHIILCTRRRNGHRIDNGRIMKLDCWHDLFCR